jgi:D-arabinono-1,4-lactone oxidase/FAD binding domain-containing protein
MSGSALDLENAASPDSARPASYTVLLSAAVAFALLGIPPIVLPGATLEQLGWPTSSFAELLLSMSALTFWLLAVSFARSRNTRDRFVLEGFARATTLFGALWLFLGFVIGRGGPWWLLAGAGVVTLAGLAASLVVARERERKGVPKPRQEGWQFTGTLGKVALLTAIVGTLLVLADEWAAALLSVEGLQAQLWLDAYGIAFWVNTLSMWPSRYSRDLRVVKAQLEGSLVFDGITVALLVWAVANHTVCWVGLLLSLVYAFICVWFPIVWLKAHALQHVDIRRPTSLMALQELIVEANQAGLLVRVQGAGHSAKAAIYADGEPRPPLPRASDSSALNVSLEHLNQVVHVDSPHHRISVQAGMHLGQNPNVPSSVDNNLLLHITARGWALPDLGGITHQTVGGFISTGSSGGSRQHSFARSVIELRFLDASGQLQVANRENNPELFLAALVSLGLFGVLVEVTFECEPSVYYVKGREMGGEILGTHWHLPTLDAEPAARRTVAEEVIDLTSSGDDGLAAYLQRIEYCRILWWPQNDRSRDASSKGWMATWEGSRVTEAPEKPAQYDADRGLKQDLAGLILDLIGLGYGKGPFAAVGRLVRGFLPMAIQLFVPIKAPKLFNDRWDKNLPMDNDVDDWVIPTEFTELWFPISQTHRVMEKLLEMYEDDAVAGTFACEIYAAQGNPAWLSPAHGDEDVFRVDVFWFGRNPQDPVREYFPQFWRELAPFGFRAHWGKHLPEPQSAEGVAYRREHFPHWDDFLRLREMYDPRGTFLSRYWRRHFGVS